ncbi:ADP-ribosylglycohydrolase [Parathielavia appendiculata]|uniref:ADP-ribosylglycohydrolase n=1 Tax=Parathielavia appendiculata TaxID=2587402 RepID=A0AAN6TT28_9PEZI|nr:ADP-ribosylglycohydrolase [Parathielavia appendiculata]
MSSSPSPPLPFPPHLVIPLVRSTLHDRVAGVLVGSALGDAIGLYTEFLSAPHAAAAYPTRKFTLTGPPHATPFKLDAHRAPKEAGHWTDDTDHALLLLLSFLHTARTETVGHDAPPPLPTQTDLAARLRVWVTQGLRVLDTMPLGLGRLVGTVVASAGFDTEPERVAREYWERTGKRVAPNGSLMRTHPLGVMCLFRGEEEAFEVAASISRVTHVDPRCVVACVIGTGLLRALVRGEVQGEGDMDALVERAVEWHRREGKGEGQELEVEELWRHVRSSGGLEDLKLDDQAAMGYVYKTLGSGVVLLRMAMKRIAASRGGLLDRTRLFEILITDLIMRGGDADTNACFAGALLGGYLGYSFLPDHWKHGLKHGEWLLSKTDALCQVLRLKDGEYSGKEDKDTEIHGGRPELRQDEMEGRWMLLQQATVRKMEETAKATSSKVTGLGWSLPWQSKEKKKR